MMQNHRTLQKATNRTFALHNHYVIWLPRWRCNTHWCNACWRSTTIDSRRSKFVNGRALPSCTCRKLWLTQIRSPSYITHRAMRAPIAMSSADPGASCHTQTPLQIQHDLQSLHLHEPSCKFTTSTQRWQWSFHQISHYNFNNQGWFSNNKELIIYDVEDQTTLQP